MHVYIDGAYQGSFSSIGQAMAIIERNAAPYSSWKIVDPYGNVAACG